jgi:hypothetical protein
LAGCWMALLTAFCAGLVEGVSIGDVRGKMNNLRRLDGR